MHIQIMNNGRETVDIIAWSTINLMKVWGLVWLLLQFLTTSKLRAREQQCVTSVAPFTDRKHDGFVSF